MLMAQTAIRLLGCPLPQKKKINKYSYEKEE